MPAMEIALERINSDQSILPGYQLQTVAVGDTRVRSEPKRKLIYKINNYKYFKIFLF